MPPATPPTTSTQRKHGRWPRLALLAWLITAAAMMQVALAWLWQDRLEPVSTPLLALHFAAFMAQVFLFHVGLAMLLIVAFSAAARRWALCAVATAACLLGTGPDVYHALSTPARPMVPPGRGLKIMSINTMMGELDPERTLAQIRNENPDIIEFQEWTDLARHKLLLKLKDTWPNVVEAPQNDPFGQATFSKRPFIEPAVQQVPGHPWEPSICVAINYDGQTLRLRDVHLLPPISRSMFAEQRAMAHTLAASAGQPAAGDVLAGDFNATPGTSILNAFERNSWQDAQRLGGTGRGTTWCRLGWVSSFPGVAIDHVLVGPRLRVLECRTGQDTGSDHRPIIAVIDWK